MSETNFFDVVIAGSGPAGCAAAIRLNQLGMSVGIVDEVNPKRLKVGESVPGAVVRMLATLGIAGMDDLLIPEHYEVSTANSSAWGSDDWLYNDAVLNPEGGGWHVMRNEFDEALRAKAKKVGVSFYDGKVGMISENENQLMISMKKQGVSTPDQLRTNYVIDATGRGRAVMRQFEVDWKQFESQMAAIAWVKCNEQDATSRVKTGENGWWYTSKLPNDLRVMVFHGVKEQIRDFVHAPEAFFNAFDEAQLFPSDFKIEEVVEGIVARDASVSLPVKMNGDRWLAVGDAAQAFDPITSQGIFHAMYSGIRGAEAIDGKRRGDQQVFQRYEENIRRIFETNQRQRKMHYTQELRWTDHPYWEQYFR